jgi:hypothetical protein
MHVEFPEKGLNDTRNDKIFVFQPIFTKFEQHVGNRMSYRAPRENSRLGVK